jgi:hypothetical protein
MLSTPRQIQSLTLVSAFARFLSHTLRTPLSIISNDLYYFKMLLPPEECDRALERCQEISEKLAWASNFTTEAASAAESNLTNLLETVFSDLQVAHSELRFSGNTAQLCAALGIYRNALAPLAQVQGAAAKLSADGEKVSVIFTFKRNQAAPQLCGIFPSLSALYLDALKSDCVLAPFADAVFLDHQAEVQLLFEDSLTLTIRFPYGCCTVSG